MTIYLYVATKKTTHTHSFNSVTEAYQFYIKHYATFGGWKYFYDITHMLLTDITDENTMKAIFRNVFKNTFIVCKEI